MRRLYCDWSTINNYFQSTEKDLFEVYQKAIQSLTIDKSSHLEFELEENKERLSKLENSKDRRILELESDVRLIKEFAKSIRKETLS